jgi:hypothetical protein
MEWSNEQALEYVKDHGAALLEELQYRTPKVTGQLVRGWRSNINAPSPEPGGPAPLSRAEFMAKMSPLKLGDSIHHTNNEPYARRIEYGWGAKNPPSGFARPALKSYVRRVKVR